MLWIMFLSCFIEWWKLFLLVIFVLNLFLFSWNETLTDLQRGTKFWLAKRISLNFLIKSINSTPNCLNLNSYIKRSVYRMVTCNYLLFSSLSNSSSSTYVKLNFYFAYKTQKFSIQWFLSIRANSPSNITQAAHKPRLLSAYPAPSHNSNRQCKENLNICPVVVLFAWSYNMEMRRKKGSPAAALIFLHSPQSTTKPPTQ